MRLLSASSLDISWMFGPIFGVLDLCSTVYFFEFIFGIVHPFFSPGIFRIGIFRHLSPVCRW